MRVYLSNAFSMTMLESPQATIKVKEIPKEKVVDYLNIADEVISVIGHPDTAELLTELLGKHIETRRVSITIKPGDVLIVAQLMGERKPVKEMTLEEIKKYPIKFYEITIEEQWNG